MIERAPVDPRKLLIGLGLVAGVGGLVLQFWVSMAVYLAAGRDIPGALGTFFTFYTILTNIVLVLIYLSEVLATRHLALFRRPVVRGMMAACIALVGLYVFAVLRHLSVLTGLFQLADTLLHYVCPLLYLLWWAIGQPHGQLRWRDLPRMLVPTMVYFVLIMARGVWVREYPYPFMSAGPDGYGPVLLNTLYITLALAALCAVVIALDHAFTRNWNVVHD
jgi:hypothetical protein